MSVLYVVIVFATGPSAAAAACEHSTMALQKCIMSNPTNETIDLFCNVTLNNAGPVAAKMHPAVAQLATFEDKQSFGHMLMPVLHIQSNAPSPFSIHSRIFVTDVERFTAACFSVLQGKPARWRITGHPDVTVSLPFLTPTFTNVPLDKYLKIPATLLRGVTAHSIEIVKTTSTMLVANLQATFFSSSVLELLNLGEMEFQIHGANGARIGISNAKSFEVRQGLNQLSNLSVTLAAYPAHDKTSQRGVTDFIKSYIGNVDQVITLRGPVANAAPFLNNLVAQEIDIPGINLMESIVVTSMDITGGTKDMLTATSVVQFVSATSMKPGSLGKLEFEIWTLPGAAGAKDGLVLGTVSMPDSFAIAKGMNEAHVVVSLPQPSTTAGEKAVAAFVGSFSEGHTNEFEMRGPVNHANPLLNNLVRKPVKILGTPDPSLMLSVFADKFTNMGFKVAGNPKKLRGAIVVSKNPYNLPITIANIKYDVHLLEPVKWTFTAITMTGGKHVECGGKHGEDRYARMYYAPGMHQYKKLCPQESCNKTDMSATVTMQPLGDTSFFVPAVPMPGQGRDGCCPICSDALSPYDCCYTSLALAAACRAQSRSEGHFMGRSNGTMDMTVGDFVIKGVRYGQDALPTLFAPDITDGIFDGVLSCQNVVIHK
jgi:hypothetical protein